MKEATLNRALDRYERSPHLVFWETTKACALACRHCRAEAQLDASPEELTSAEGRMLIDQVAAFDGPSPILVFTGGDCLARPDLVELVGYANSRGIRMGIAPSVTERLTRERLLSLYELGVRSVSISLDGATPESHDTLRGVSGHFDQTFAAIAMLNEMGFRVQVNTTVTRDNARELADIFVLLRTAQVKIWEVFFLVGVGRGVDVLEVSPSEAEDVCHFLVDVSAYSMTVRTVEGPFYRRVQAERAPFGSLDPREHFDLGELYSALRARVERSGLQPERSISCTTLATGDGRGVIFVGHDGEVHGSGFLPVPLGNVRTESLQRIYTQSLLLTVMRSGLLLGECGRCEYTRLCGGSRARAFAQSGRALDDDPSCLRVERATHVAVPAAVACG